MNMEIKDYTAPQTKVIEVKSQGVLCGSLDGCFGVSNNGNVERGDDSDWD